MWSQGLCKVLKAVTEQSAIGRKLCHITTSTNPKAQGESLGKDRKNERMGRIVVKFCLLAMTGLLYTRTPSSCYYLTQDLCKIKSVKIS